MQVNPTILQQIGDAGYTIAKSANTQSLESQFANIMKVYTDGYTLGAAVPSAESNVQPDTISSQNDNAVAQLMQINANYITAKPQNAPLLQNAKAVNLEAVVSAQTSLQSVDVQKLLDFIFKNKSNIEDVSVQSLLPSKSESSEADDQVQDLSNISSIMALLQQNQSLCIELKNGLKVSIVSDQTKESKFIVSLQGEINEDTKVNSSDILNNDIITPNLSTESSPEIVGETSKDSKIITENLSYSNLESNNENLQTVKFVMDFSKLKDIINKSSSYQNGNIQTEDDVTVLVEFMKIYNDSENVDGSINNSLDGSILKKVENALPNEASSEKNSVAANTNPIIDLDKKELVEPTDSSPNGVKTAEFVTKEKAESAVNNVIDLDENLGIKQNFATKSENSLEKEISGKVEDISNNIDVENLETATSGNLGEPIGKSVNNSVSFVQNTDSANDPQKNNMENKSVKVEEPTKEQLVAENQTLNNVESSDEIDFKKSFEKINKTEELKSSGDLKINIPKNFKQDSAQTGSSDSITEISNQAITKEIKSVLNEKSVTGNVKELSNAVQANIGNSEDNTVVNDSNQVKLDKNIAESSISQNIKVASSSIVSPKESVTKETKQIETSPAVKEGENAKISDGISSASKSDTDSSGENKNKQEFMSKNTEDINLLNSNETKKIEFSNSFESDNQAKEVTKNVRVHEIIKEVSKFMTDKNNGILTLKIDPDRLGKMKVTIEVVNDVVKASVEVENEAVKKLVENNQPQLKETLIQQGLNLSQLHISLASYSESKSGTSQQNNSKYKGQKKFKLSEGNKDGDNAEEDVKSTQKNYGYNKYEYVM